MGLMEQYVDIYRISDSEDRFTYREKVNDMISKGWVVKQITGTGGSNNTSPSISVLFEREKETKEID